MDNDNVLINRVAQSGLITINLEDFYPPYQIKSFDLKDYLFQGLILKEMDFRNALKQHDWQQYRDAYLAVHCSSDAIIPTWAFMLVAAYASGIAREIGFGNHKEFLKSYFSKKINQLDPENYRDAKLVIKGCSDKEVPASAYLEITALLKPYASSIMFGEPCSTVPVYKKVKSQE